MAKKKKTNQKTQNTLSPEKYIRTKARNLPIEECLISKGWKESGEGNVVIARRHASGNYTVGFFLVDLYCLGVKDCFYHFNIFGDDYRDLKATSPWDSIDYNEAHNIIYGAVAYAEELGITPYKDFNTLQYILEPDTDDIPLIEYEFGHNGKPFLIAGSMREAAPYLSALRRTVGEGAFTYCLEDEPFQEDTDLPHPLEMMETLQKIEQMYERLDSLPSTIYNYAYPEYPRELTLRHPKELEILSSPKREIYLKTEEIKTILSLPHETLAEDLKNAILYEIGQTYREISFDLWDKPFSPILSHALFLLGELKIEDTIDVILEVLRQNVSFMEYHFGDASPDILPLTLYYVGRNQLPKLMEYAKEPGLFVSFKIQSFSAVSIIATFEPERRNEVILWYKDILQFYLDNIDDSSVYDASLIGLLSSELLAIKAIELLPLLEQLYSTGLVDEMCCGDFEDVKKEMESNEIPLLYHDSLMNIYERYEAFRKKWEM